MYSYESSAWSGILHLCNHFGETRKFVIPEVTATWSPSWKAMSGCPHLLASPSSHVAFAQVKAARSPAMPGNFLNLSPQDVGSSGHPMSCHLHFAASDNCIPRHSFLHCCIPPCRPLYTASSCEKIVQVPQTFALSSAHRAQR